MDSPSAVRPRPPRLPAAAREGALEARGPRWGPSAPRVRRGRCARGRDQANVSNGRGKRTGATQGPAQSSGAARFRSLVRSVLASIASFVGVVVTPEVTGEPGSKSRSALPDKYEGAYSGGLFSPASGLTGSSTSAPRWRIPRTLRNPLPINPGLPCSLPSEP